MRVGPVPARTLAAKPGSVRSRAIHRQLTRCWQKKTLTLQDRAPTSRSSRPAVRSARCRGETGLPSGRDRTEHLQQERQGAMRDESSGRDNDNGGSTLRASPASEADTPSPARLSASRVTRRSSLIPARFSIPGRSPMRPMERSTRSVRMRFSSAMRSLATSMLPRKIR